jgi:hypothetical protein
MPQRIEVVVKIVPATAAAFDLMDGHHLDPGVAAGVDPTGSLNLSQRQQAAWPSGQRRPESVPPASAVGAGVKAVDDIVIIPHRVFLLSHQSSVNCFHIQYNRPSQQIRARERYKKRYTEIRLIICPIGPII